MAANDIQHGGSHYKAMAIQPWDYIVANRLGYLEGNVVKYITRWREKGGLDDLKKAQHYLEKLIEVELAWSAPAGERSRAARRARRRPELRRPAAPSLNKHEPPCQHEVQR